MGGASLARRRVGLACTRCRRASRQQRSRALRRRVVRRRPPALSRRQARLKTRASLRVPAPARVKPRVPSRVPVREPLQAVRRKALPAAAPAVRQRSPPAPNPAAPARAAGTQKAQVQAGLKRQAAGPPQKNLRAALSGPSSTKSATCSNTSCTERQTPTAVPACFALSARGAFAVTFLQVWR